MGRRKQRQRPHRPEQLGPRLIRRGRWWAADLRPWGGGRPTLRDPSAPGWPDAGERTTSQEVAERWRWAYHSEHHEGAKARQLGRPRAKPRPIGKLLDRWLDEREMQVAYGTWLANRTAAKRLRELFGADRDIASIETGELQAELTRLLRAGYQRTSVTVERAMWRAFFGWAGRPEVMTDTHVPAPEATEIFTWSDEQLEQLRDACDVVDGQLRHPHARRAFETALATGVRRQELFALPWTAIDPRSLSVRISRQLGRTGLAPLKGKLARTAIVLPSFWAFYQPTDGLIVTTSRGKPIGWRAGYELMERILDTAGLNGHGRGWHDCRRTYGRLVLEGGARMEDLQRFLGHTSIRTTERSYGRYDPDKAVESAASKIYGTDRPLRVVR